MTLLADRVDDLLHAPVSAAMFVLADEQGLSPERLADPSTVSALASTAMCELNPWSSGSAASREQAVHDVKGLRQLVTAVATDPRNAWWSAPIDRTAQLLLTGTEEQWQDPMRLPVPAGPVTGWETYAQKPKHGIVTSTELAVPQERSIRCGAHAELACGLSDWCPTYPIRQLRLQVLPTARIYEIDSPADWHRLAVRYGDPATHVGSDRHLLKTAGIDNGLAPTWSAVAADYDSVHLTFTGLLTSLYVPVTTGSVSTTLWAWDFECTYWIRSVFHTATPLPDLTEAPRDDYSPGQTSP